MAIASRKRHPPETQASSAPSATSAPLRPYPTLRRSNAGPPLNGFHEVNERCIEMLVSAARHGETPSFALVSELRELLESADRSMRQRAARVSFLLVDMEFGNPDFWHVVCSQPGQQLKTPLWRGSFPRGSAIQLAHATLMLAWNSLRSDPATARILLGMVQSVSDLIVGLRFDEIDRIAHKRFRHVRPRWDDRPAVWRRLLLGAQSDDAKLLGALNLHALQLLTGELLTRERRGGPFAVSRVSAPRTAPEDQVR
jgi:hypothetical protein